MLKRILKRAGEEATRPLLRSWLHQAYAEAGGAAHARIMRHARAWYGIEKAGRICQIRSTLFIEYLFQAQRRLFEAGESRDLGPAPIGFEELRIGCRSSDANSSLVYLYGFSDNRSYFDIYREFVKPGSAVLDIGANLGIHTLVLSRCVGIEGCVHAVEPVPAHFDRLKANLSLNAVENVRCHPVAVGDRQGTIGFDLNEGDFNIGKAHIAASSAKEVALTTVDRLLEEESRSLSLIKVDVEGHELAVLRGARARLEADRPAVIAEFHPGSMSEEELRGALPFEARFFVVPVSDYELPRPLEGTPSHPVDVLAVPA